jgi:hypothetical protein
MLPVLFDWLLRGLRNPLAYAFPTPDLREEREERGTHCVLDDCEIKSLGQPQVALGSAFDQ